MPANRVVDEHLTSPVLVYSGSGVFENEKVLSAGFGIQISDEDGRLVITSTGGASEGSLSGVTQILGGTGIRVLTSSAGTMTICADRGYASAVRHKQTLEVAAPIPSGIPVSFNSISFDAVNYDDASIDVLLNGQALVTGSDYLLAGPASVVFMFDLRHMDRVTATALSLDTSRADFTSAPVLLAAPTSGFDAARILTGSAGVTVTDGGPGGALRVGLAQLWEFDETPVGDQDGLNKAFSLARTPTPPASLMLFLNGARLRREIDFIMSGSRITYGDFAPLPSDIVIATYMWTS